MGTRHILDAQTQASRQNTHRQRNNYNSASQRAARSPRRRQECTYAHVIIVEVVVLVHPALAHSASAASASAPAQPLPSASSGAPASASTQPCGEAEKRCNFPAKPSSCCSPASPSSRGHAHLGLGCPWTCGTGSAPWSSRRNRRLPWAPHSLHTGFQGKQGTSVMLETTLGNPSGSMCGGCVVPNHPALEASNPTGTAHHRASGYKEQRYNFKNWVMSGYRRQGGTACILHTPPVPVTGAEDILKTQSEKPCLGTGVCYPPFPTSVTEVFFFLSFQKEPFKMCL